MKHILPAQPRAFLRIYLAAGYLFFIMYASLSPFTGWQEQGLEFYAVLTTPLFVHYTWFDVAANLLAYLPFGLLFGLALRAHMEAPWSVLLTVLAGLMLSAAMEYMQMYLPSRISSNLDLLTNTSGALLGALLAVGIASRAWFKQHLMHWRLRLFHHGVKMDFGLAWVVLWMFAQTNPALPMLGNVFISKARIPFVVVQPEPFNWLASVTVTLNLLMLGMVLLTLLRKRHHAVNALLLILCLVALTKFITAVVLLKSWALLLWLNTEAMLGIFFGILLLATAMRLPRVMLLGCAAIVALLYLVLAHGILDSGAPAASMRLYQWSYGHLLNYNGLSLSIALILPFLMLGYLWQIRRLRK